MGEPHIAAVEITLIKKSDSDCSVGSRVWLDDEVITQLKDDNVL